MIPFLLALIFSFPAITGDSTVDLFPADGSASSIAAITYHDGHAFTVIGKYHNEKNYARFPAKYKGRLRDKVWDLGQHSAGISIRFRTNSPTIIVRWTLINNSSLTHMPDTGVKGVDMYAFQQDHWQYVQTGFPRHKENEYIMLEHGDGLSREYLLNLPLYDGVESVHIGVESDAEITKPADPHLLSEKPVVYYGTSIAQGGCASRPGLAFTNILSRSLNRSFVNFGFSGNGNIETSVGEAMCEIDAALYVIDCNPNTKTELIYDRTMSLVAMLKKNKSKTPVLLVGGFPDESRFFNPASGVNQDIAEKQKELRRAYDALRKSGVSEIYFKKGDNLVGTDHEGTVDGIHPNDIGMMRIAYALEPMISWIVSD